MAHQSSGELMGCDPASATTSTSGKSEAMKSERNSFISETRFQGLKPL